jgi:hypothetical protein
LAYAAAASSIAAATLTAMLPNAKHALVEPAKLRDYLLAQAHPVGRFKARFFCGLGYTSEGWQVLRDDLLRLASSGEAEPSQPGLYGQKFTVSGTLSGPNGRSATVVSVWLMPANGDAPRFITAYPG